VWATSATSAWKHLGALGLQGLLGRSPRALDVATGYDIDCLDQAFPWPGGTVLATSNHNGNVVEIVTRRLADDNLSHNLNIRPVGTLTPGYVFTPAEPQEGQR